MTDILELAPDLPADVLSQEDYDLLVEALAAAKSSCKVHESSPEYRDAKVVVKTFRNQIKPYEELEASLRARLIYAKRLYETAVDEAIQAGVQVPEGLVDPVGISWRRVKKWRIPDEATLDPAFRKSVPDEERIEAVIASGNSVAGVQVYDDYVLTYRG